MKFLKLCILGSGALLLPKASASRIKTSDTTAQTAAAAQAPNESIVNEYLECVTSAVPGIELLAKGVDPKILQWQSCQDVDTQAAAQVVNDILKPVQRRLQKACEHLTSDTIPVSLGSTSSLGLVWVETNYSQSLWLAGRDTICTLGGCVGAGLIALEGTVALTISALLPTSGASNVEADLEGGWTIVSYPQLPLPGAGVALEVGTTSTGNTIARLLLTFGLAVSAGSNQVCWLISGQYL